MSEEIRNINLTIADRPYRLNVSADEESTLLQAEKQLDLKISELKKSYQAKDRQDYLAMTALTYCIETLRFKNENKSQKVLNKQLDELDSFLTDFLDNTDK